MDLGYEGQTGRRCLWGHGGGKCGRPWWHPMPLSSLFRREVPAVRSGRTPKADPQGEGRLRGDGAQGRLGQDAGHSDRRHVPGQGHRTALRLGHPCLPSADPRLLFLPVLRGHRVPVTGPCADRTYIHCELPQGLRGPRLAPRKWGEREAAAQGGHLGHKSPLPPQHHRPQDEDASENLREALP